MVGAVWFIDSRLEMTHQYIQVIIEEMERGERELVGKWGGDAESEQS